jgi:hypothetical protein
MRVHQLAKEYDKKSSDFLTEIQGYGINVFSHLSGLSDDEVATIRQKIETKDVAIKLETEVTKRQVGGDREFETYTDEDRLEEEPKKDNWTLGSEDSVVDPPKVGVSSEEVQESLATNIKAAGEAREEYAKTSKAISEDPENWATLSVDDGESDTDLSFGQKAFAKAKAEEKITTKDIIDAPEVEVERSSGFFGWLKGLFS